MHGTVLIEREGRVALFTVNRPDKLNALNEQVREDMLEALAQVEHDDAVGVVVITGAGEKSFIAGADISEFEGRSPFDQRESMRFPRVFDIMGAFPKPVIAMVNGFCLGGGCELAMSCDVRIAAEAAVFGQPEIRLGIIPGGGGTQRLARVLGKQRAMEYVLTGQRFDAATAQELGLVNKVVEKDRWLSEAMALAGTVAERPPIAARLAKQAVLAAEETALSAGLESERRLYELAMATEDRIEGMRAFLEKREPEFEGR